MKSKKTREQNNTVQKLVEKKQMQTNKPKKWNQQVDYLKLLVTQIKLDTTAQETKKKKHNNIKN